MTVLMDVAVAVALAAAIFAIGLSSGRVLDLRFASQFESITPTLISLFCWWAVVLFAVRIAVGRWKHDTSLKRWVVTGLLLAPPLLLILSLMPESEPDTIRALLAGASAGLAHLLAWKIKPDRVGR